MDQGTIREIALTVSTVGGAVTVWGGLTWAALRGVPRMVAAWQRKVIAKAEKDEAITTTVRLVPEVVERVKRLEREVVPNGDPMDDHRPLRDHVRTQGQVQHAQSGAIEEIRQRLAVGDLHFAAHDRRLEHLEAAHEHRGEGQEQ